VTLLGPPTVPLGPTDGSVMQVPADFEFGFWVAIVIGVVFLAAYAWRVATEIHAMSDALLATQMALAREQKLTDLGGVVAAAAHELGTPLATIKLVSAELDRGTADPRASRRRELIRDPGRPLPRHPALDGPGRKGRPAPAPRPLATVLREAAEPHAGRGKEVIHYDIAPGRRRRRPPARDPRRPEVIHGLRNLIQNAVDFAAATSGSTSLERDSVTCASSTTGRAFRRRCWAASASPSCAAARRRPWRPAGLRRHGAGALHRQDAAGTHRRGARLRQRTRALHRASPAAASAAARWSKRSGPAAAVVAEEVEAGRPLGANQRIEV
jgi:hypothetical protein